MLCCKLLSEVNVLAFYKQYHHIETDETTIFKPLRGPTQRAGSHWEVCETTVTVSTLHILWLCVCISLQ